jgi:hypothetical protein
LLGERSGEQCQVERPAADEGVVHHQGPAREPQLHMPWMFEPSPGMERQLLQRHWRALAHWKPARWHLPLAVYLDEQPIGVQDLWATDFARLRTVGT